MKPARLRPQAESDLVEAARYYAGQGGRSLGERAFDTALDALGTVERMPGMGSPRIGQWCGIAGLRAWRVGAFPLVWLYLERDDHLDVIRLLGERQDFPLHLLDDPADGASTL